MTDHSDLIQDTYIRLFKARSSGRKGINRAYLFVVARNAGLDLVRHQGRVAMKPIDGTEELDVVDEGVGSPAETISREQELQLVREAIEQLPPRCAEVLRLQRFDGLSYREIAEKLFIAERTVNVLLAKGVVRCRRYLADRGLSFR